jgi:hypothetical protein
MHSGVGLSESEHLRCAGLLNRVRSGLRGVAAILNGRYAAGHAIPRECTASTASVRALQVELDNAVHREHPSTRLSYLSETGGVSQDAIASAFAGPGDGVGETD